VQHRSLLAGRLAPASSLLSVAALLSLVVAAPSDAGWTWTVALVAVAGVLAVAALPRLVAAPAPAVHARVRRRRPDEPARQSAPGRRGRPRPRAPGAPLRAPTPLPAGHPTG